MLAWSCFIGALLVGAYQARFHWLMLRVVAALWGGGKPPSKAGASDRRFVILVPAHNEEQGLPATLRSLGELDYPRELYEVLVIADNCSDQTAMVGRAAGASVLERSDAHKKSKGYALEYALQELGARPTQPDAVVIIDADTRVDTNLLQVFAATLQEGKDWMQAYYTVSNPDDNLRTQLMTYAFGLFNGSWLLAQDRLGMSCALRGNGMCFSWAGLQRCPWQAYGLAEDLEFSWHLRLAGERVYFLASSRVYGEMIAEQSQATASQRLRWEHGRRNLRASFGEAVDRSPLLRRQRRLLQADLFMPALSRYVAFILILLGLSGSFMIMAPPEARVMQWLLGSYTVTLCVVLLLYLISPFYFLGLPWRYAGSLLRAPFYMLWKLRLAAGPAPASWNRAARKHESKNPSKP